MSDKYYEPNSKEFIDGEVEPKPNGLAPHEQPVSTNPVCPYCGADPMVFNASDILMPNGVILLGVFCANQACRKMLTISFAGRAPGAQRLTLAQPMPDFGRLKH